jgi:hypothetical protein
MRFATTSNERTPEELAARLFGTAPDDPATKRAANALVRANPVLKQLEELPPTVVAVPDVRGVEPAIAMPPLPAAAASLLLGAALEHVDDIASAAKELVGASLDDARAHKKELNAAEVKKRARADKRYAAWLRESEADVEGEVQELRALTREQKTAMTELAQDLEALLEVLGRSGET